VHAADHPQVIRHMLSQLCHVALGYAVPSSHCCCLHSLANVAVAPSCWVC
jgi:hypothetical protein